MTDFDHPKWPARHVPRHESNDLGCTVTCSCGWWTTARTAPKATRAWLEHENAEPEAAS